jgi:hypothetical protein
LLAAGYDALIASFPATSDGIVIVICDDLSRAVNAFAVDSHLLRLLSLFHRFAALAQGDCDALFRRIASVRKLFDVAFDRSAIGALGKRHG